MGERLVKSCAVMALGLLAPTAFACTIVAGGTIDSDFRNSENVVLAEVVGGSRTAQSDDAAADYAVETVEFRVLVSWKGTYKAGSRFTTKTSIGPGSCGLSVDPTLRVLVKTPPGKLSAGSIWVLFLGEGAPLELSSASSTARLGDGGEATMKRLYELSGKRHQP